MYSEVIVKRVVRLKRGSSRSIRSPVAVRIERSALGLDRNVPHAFVRALRRELVNRHTQNFRGMATAQMALRSRGTACIRLEIQRHTRIHFRWRDFRSKWFRLLGFARACLGTTRFTGPSLPEFFCRHGGLHITISKS